jgi:hypothetical protein
MKRPHDAKDCTCHGCVVFDVTDGGAREFYDWTLYLKLRLSRNPDGSPRNPAHR